MNYISNFIWKLAKFTIHFLGLDCYDNRAATHFMDLFRVTGAAIVRCAIIRRNHHKRLLNLPCSSRCWLYQGLPGWTHQSTASGLKKFGKDSKATTIKQPSAQATAKWQGGHLLRWHKTLPYEDHLKQLKIPIARFLQMVKALILKGILKIYLLKMEGVMVRGADWCMNMQNDHF